MKRGPYFSPLLLFPVFFLLALMILVQLGIISIAFQKLGLSPTAGLLILMAVVAGSGINLPLFRMKTSEPENLIVPWLHYPFLRPFRREFSGMTIVAVNIGGCVIPVALSIYLLFHSNLEPGITLIAITFVTMIAYLWSRPVPGIGIGMPVFIAPLTAVVIASLLDPQQRGALAYVSGTLGVLIGADLLRFRDIRALGAPVASIGGAGTFDGIFLTGIVAVLLA